MGVHLAKFYWAVLSGYVYFSVCMLYFKKKAYIENGKKEKEIKLN